MFTISTLVVESKMKLLYLHIKNISQPNVKKKNHYGAVRLLKTHSFILKCIYSNIMHIDNNTPQY